jgi:hypothetical protein
MHPLRSSLVVILAALLLAGATGLALGQAGIPTSAFGLAPRIGSGDAMSTRDLAMGAISSCLYDVQFPNPAFCGVNRLTDVGLRGMETDFSHGPRLESAMLHYEHPLHPGIDGFQITALTMDSGRGATPLGPEETVNTDMTDKEIIVDYGHSFGSRTVAGLSVLGGEQSVVAFNTPEGPLQALKSNAGFGFRLGAAQRWGGPGDYLGFIYSNSQNNVDASGMEEEGTGGFARVVYHGDDLNVGAAHHIGSKVLAAVEFERGTTSRGSYLSGEDVWHFGLEYTPERPWAVRFGVAGGEPTAGLGYAQGRWRVDYAYLHDLNDADFHSFFGNSVTNALHVTYLF